MFSKIKEPRSQSTSKSSIESDRKCEKTGRCENSRKLSVNQTPNQDLISRSFKTTRKKDPKGSSADGLFLKSYLNSQSSDNQVPSSDPYRFAFRRDENKTDWASDCNEEPVRDVLEGTVGPREPVFVRETKASRLRAASRTSSSEIGSPSIKPLKDVKKTESNVLRTFVSCSSTLYSLNKKDLDRSHTRKSHLNRSHTSEGVYDDVPIPGGSNIRRRRSKHFGSASLTTKSGVEKFNSSASMGSANGTAKEIQTPFEQFSRSCSLAQNSLNACRKSADFIGKSSQKPSEEKKLIDDLDSLTPQMMLSPEQRFDKSKSVDIASRAEILAVSTLKMINRLDEINYKSRTSADFGKKNLPFNTVINGEDSGTPKTDWKKVSPQEEITAEICSNRVSIKADNPSANKSSEDKKFEVKPSILKNKPLDIFYTSGDSQKPVSILKRKPSAQNDFQSSSPPVTFSPSVFKKKSEVKKQGIMKKRRSLDENEVMQRRSYSAEASYDFKSILKTQRRSSMEELTRRSHSPDSTPQGILKRRSSKEEDMEDGPQGILKRKSLPCLNFHQNVKIFERVTSETVDNGNVRPILKKKSSSEEYSTSESGLTEGPKSILKKKATLEIDESDEKPMKPILKSSKIPSVEEPEKGKRNRSLIVNPLEEQKPILKRENSRSGENESRIVLRSVASRHERPHSSSDIDSELSAIFLKRRSLEFQPISAVSFDLDVQKSKRGSSNDRSRGTLLKRPLSVAEKINNLENFLNVEKMERGGRISPQKVSLSNFLELNKVENQEMIFGCTSNSFPTAEFGNEFAHTASKLCPEEHRKRVSLEEPPALEIISLNSVSSLKTQGSNDLSLSSYSDARSQENLKLKKSSLRTLEHASIDQLFRKTSCHSPDSEQVFPVNTLEELDAKNEIVCNHSVDFCGKKISSLNLKELVGESSKEIMDDPHFFLLQKSGMVSAKTSLFRDTEKKKTNEEVRKVMTEPSENIQMSHSSLEKKLPKSNFQRNHIQSPSTEEEIKLDVLQKKSTTKDKCRDGAENHEDELCTMSYEDRLRIFESNFIPKFPESVSKKRGTRYRTQPVTTDEMQKAQNERFFFTLDNHSTKKIDGHSFCFCGSQENNVDLSTRHVKSNSPDSKSKIKGILKNLSSSNEFKTSNSDSDSSTYEKKGILKNEFNENSQNIRRVLKKEDKEEISDLKGILKQPSLEKKVSSSSEEEPVKDDWTTSSTLMSPGENLAFILQRMELVGRSRSQNFFRKEESKMSPKCMQNEIGEKVTSKTKNNPPIVKNRSHSSVALVLQPSLKCSFSDRIPTLDTVSGGNSLEHGKAKSVTDSFSKSEADEGLLRLKEVDENTTQTSGDLNEDAEDDLSGASIHDRLARLKKRGEIDWQKRKSHKINLEDEFSIISSGNYLLNDHFVPMGENRLSASHTDRKEIENIGNSSSVLADRLGKLDAAKQGWKKRIKPSDAVRFSVEGKMLEKRDSLNSPNEEFQVSPTRTPLIERKKKSPKAVRFRSKQCNFSLSSMPSSALEKIISPITRSLSAPESGKDGFSNPAILEELDEVKGPIVTIPKNDDETFTSFFNSWNNQQIFQECLEIKDEDLEAITKMKSSQLLVQKRNIKTQKRRATNKNPLKALATRFDLQEYTEVKTEIAEKELKRMKTNKAAKNSTLAIEALAGLASQEDFTAVNLKKPTEVNVNSSDAPYKDLMLLHVKGRRHVQTRLVEPAAYNINTGDCFILVTPNRIFHYVGEFANVIEKSRGAEISSYIQQKGDLGCTTSSVITIGEGGKASREQLEEFWKLLGGEPGCEKEAGNLDEDELFELALIDTNMIYEVLNNELVPVEAYWGSIPKIDLLDPNKVLVFDFGSEFYVWNGKNVSVSRRKIALKIAKELWDEGFDYTDCDLCPITAIKVCHLGNQTSWCGISDSDKAGVIRPSWTLFAKLTQNMETILFREKFSDWPDYTRGFPRGKKTEQISSSGALNFKPCDAKKMLENILPEPDLVLEGSHLGRGVRYIDEETKKRLEITTLNVTVWHVNEYEYSELSTQSVGQFHMEDNYVVRWHYCITSSGRELSGQPSKHLTTGRNRYVYFFWQGHDSPVNDRGAAACLTVELDKEHGPQVRVVQGFEPPAFLNLFKGRMVVHKGRRRSQVSREKLRLFICRGAVESELALYEVSCSMRQLRSLASFVLVNKETGKIFVWHGQKSPENFRKFAFTAAERLQLETPEFEFTAEKIIINEEIEGNESQELIMSLGGDNRQLYHSLKEETELRTPRLFHLTSVSGEFLFNEVTSFQLKKNSITPLPFLQSDLYCVPQPALFLLDSCSGLWLWQGWLEALESDRGSGYIRFQAERRAAMSTAVAYWNLKYKTSTPKIYLIWAGLEPLLFTNQFPFWTDRDDVAEMNMKEGRKPGEAVPILAELSSVNQSTYPLAQLQNRPLPEGVNPTSLENYLEPHYFPKVFAMKKEEFLNLPSWKKKKLKQDAGLF